MMFASQAALVIANARRYQEEQQARADLEALVDTSPVAVLLFDGLDGKIVAHNREVRRLANVLNGPEATFEEVLSTLTIRRGDGKELTMAEFPIAETLRTGGVVRLEQMVLRARAVKTSPLWSTPRRSSRTTASCGLLW